MTEPHGGLNRNNQLERMFGFCSVYLEAPWYETLILQLHFNVNGELEPEKSILTSIAAFRSKENAVALSEENSNKEAS